LTTFTDLQIARNFIESPSALLFAVPSARHRFIVIQDLLCTLSDYDEQCQLELEARALPGDRVIITVIAGGYREPTTIDVCVAGVAGVITCDVGIDVFADALLSRTICYLSLVSLDIITP